MSSLSLSWYPVYIEGYSFILQYLFYVYIFLLRSSTLFLNNILFLNFGNRISMYCSGWPRTCSSPSSINLLTTTIAACATMPRLKLTPFPLFLAVWQVVPKSFFPCRLLSDLLVSKNWFYNQTWGIFHCFCKYFSIFLSSTLYLNMTVQYCSWLWGCQTLLFFPNIFNYSLKCFCLLNLQVNGCFLSLSNTLLKPI